MARERAGQVALQRGDATAPKVPIEWANLGGVVVAVPKIQPPSRLLSQVYGRLVFAPKDV